MSLLAELEELQRCLEGTADSDSEDASNTAAPAADSRVSGQEDEASHTDRGKGEPTSFVQVSVSRYPLHAETVREKPDDKEHEIGLDPGDAGIGKSSQQSAANSDGTESVAQIPRSQTSSQESTGNKVHISKSGKQEVTTVDMVKMKDVLPESGMIQANVRRDSTDGKVSRGKLLGGTCTKKHSPSRNLKISTLKQNELKTSSHSEEVIILACKVPDTSALNKSTTNTDSLPKRIGKLQAESRVSESETLPISSPASVNEDSLIFKEMELEGMAQVNKNDAPELQTIPKQATAAVRQAQGVIPSPSKSEGVKVLPVPLKVSSSDAGPVVGSRSKDKSSSPSPSPQSTHIALRACVNSTADGKSSLDADCHTSDRIQPTPANCVFSTDSEKASALEEVRISNKRPVIRVLSVSSDCKKSKSDTAAVSVGAPAPLSASRGRNVTKQEGPASSPSGVTKRNISFEFGSALVEKQPAVVTDVCKQDNSKQLGKIDEGPDNKERKLSAAADSSSVNAVSSQHFPGTSEPTVEQKCCDISVVPGNIPVESGCLLQKVRVRPNSERSIQELWSKLAHSQAVPVGTPLLRRKRAASDPVASPDDKKSRGFSPSGGKRRKLSACELVELLEEPLDSESTGSATVAHSSANRIIPMPSAVELGLLPQVFEENVQTVPLSTSEDVEMDKGDPGKEFLKAKVVLKKLNIPVPERMPSLPAQHVKTVKTKPQILQRTLEKVSKMLEVTLTESSPPKKRKVGRPRKVQDVLEEPVKEQNVVKQPVLQHKVMGKPTKQKTVGKQVQQKTVGRQTQQKIIRKASQHKITGKPSQHKCAEKSKPQKAMGKSSQQKLVAKAKRQKLIAKAKQQKLVAKAKRQKLVAKAKQQKTVRKPVRQQKAAMRTKAVQKTSPSNWPNIAIKIASTKKKVVPNTVASSRSKAKLQVPRKSKTNSQKVAPSVTAKKTIKRVSFKNPKHRQSSKSVANRRRGGQKKMESVKNKNVALNRSKQNKFDAKEMKVFLKKTAEEASQRRENEMVLLESDMRHPAVKAAKMFQQKNPAAMNRLPELKKAIAVDKNVKKPHQIAAVKPSKLDGCGTGADDEWIVEVLLDDTEIDMVTLNSQVKVGQDANISKVSSSDDSPKDLIVDPSDSERSHSLECDSSTDMNKWRTLLSMGKSARRNIYGNESNTVLNMHQKMEVAIPSMKQVTPSSSMGRRADISAEKKMVEMKKAIGDLERIADRSMLRLKAEERRVVDLTNRLHEYENDKHHGMLRKILRDAAPGPKQNPHAEFILDLVLSYCPEDDATLSS
jgi:hypothetical protein